ncbi:HTH-type transcriptional activator RhaR [Arenibacter antarcticus]|uniref:Helix-turn-helix domain-containing protein n=1 Tax=Arenibacter antarcticus TaxID=2040469 RepID=A0ABW5VE04_9FLAO|nr:helix-turn-helix domain-containing protein [Arenibacter sp. H213]
MTKKGIPVEKKFNSLLNDYQGDDKGFIVNKSEDLSSHPKYRDLDSANLTGHEFLSDRIYYCNCRKSGNLNKTFTIDCNENYIQLFMGLKGSLRISDGKGAFIDILPNTVQLVKYSCGQIQITELSEGNVEAFIINIHNSVISPEKAYFENILSFAKHSPSSTINTFSDCPFLIDYRMRQIVEELAYKKYTGCFLEHYIEIKVLELLLLYISEWNHSMSQSAPENLSEDNRIPKQMALARKLLLANLSETPSLKSLATAVGTNEYYLKVHFKAHFGNSVMAYLREYKMGKAKKLLLESDRKITDIAESLGYKYATHFSAAFKKHYGKLPTDYR